MKKKNHTLQINNTFFDFSKRTYVMGVLNVTPDSFYDGAKYNSLEAAIKYAVRMQEDGADIIDIGGESSRPGSMVVEVEEELGRVIPVINAIRKEINVPISIDSYKSEVIQAALDAGVDIVNDISGLRDKKVRDIVIKYRKPVIIMHMQGTPQDMQNNPVYTDVVDEVYGFLEEQAELIKEEGLDDSNIIIDPGVGFGKTVEHNIELIRRLAEFKKMQYPILIGTSNKSFIGSITDAKVGNRLSGTIASNSIAALNGANIIRVHDVAAAKQAMQVVNAIKG